MLCVWRGFLIEVSLAWQLEQAEERVLRQGASRQEQLEQDLHRVWEQDPIAILETKGTPEVHGKEEAVN